MREPESLCRRLVRTGTAAPTDLRQRKRLIEPPPALGQLDAQRFDVRVGVRELPRERRLLGRRRRQRLLRLRARVCVVRGACECVSVCVRDPVPVQMWVGVGSARGGAESGCCEARGEYRLGMLGCRSLGRRCTRLCALAVRQRALQLRLRAKQIKARRL